MSSIDMDQAVGAYASETRVTLAQLRKGRTLRAVRRGVRPSGIRQRDSAMTTSTRRHFVLQLAAAGAAIGNLDARAQGAGPKLSESDPQAIALGYKDDSSKVDAKKYPKHEPTQVCANCQLFQGKAGDATAGCALFPGKQVASAGWCSAWNKRVG